MAKNQGMSLNPEDFTEGGGLLDDAIVVWNEVKFEMFDYQGKAKAVPALKVGMEDEEGETHEQYWSMGSANDWSPSADGKMLVAVGSATGIRAGSNGALLLKSLVDSGFPVDKIDDDITVFEGLQCHVIQIPAPKRPGLKSTKPAREDGREFEKTLLVVDEIITLPWDRKKPAGAPAKKGVAKKAPAKKGKADAKDDVDGLITKAQDTVLGIVLEQTEVSKKKLPTLVFAALKDDADRNAIAKLVFDDEFLAGGEWVYDAGSEVLSVE